MGLSEAGIDALRYPRPDSDGVVVEGTFPASGDVYVFFSKDRRTMKALKWDGDGFLMYTKRLSQGRFREVLKTGDDGVRRLQWDDFYMLMRPYACEGNGGEPLQNGCKIGSNILAIRANKWCRKLCVSDIFRNFIP